MPQSAAAIAAQPANSSHWCIGPSHRPSESGRLHHVTKTHEAHLGSPCPIYEGGLSMDQAFSTMVASRIFTIGQGPPDFLAIRRADDRLRCKVIPGPQNL